MSTHIPYYITTYNTHACAHTHACMYMHVHLCTYMWVCVEDITNTFDCLTNNIIYAVTLGRHG